MTDRAFPDLCCTKKLLVRRLLYLDSDCGSEGAFFSQTLVVPRGRGERGRRLRAVRLATLPRLARDGIVEESSELSGCWRLVPAARRYYRANPPREGFTLVRG